MSVSSGDEIESDNEPELEKNENPPQNANEDLSALVHLLMRRISAYTRNALPHKMKRLDIVSEVSKQFELPIKKTDMDNAIDAAVAAYVMYSPGGDGAVFKLFHQKVEPPAFAAPRQTRLEKFTFTLFGNANFLAVAALAGIDINLNTDGNGVHLLQNFIETHAHQWVVEARKRNPEDKYDNPKYPYDIQRVRIALGFNGQLV
jgi:hypothetical protein